MGVCEWLVTAQIWQVWEFERESLFCAPNPCSAAFSLLWYPTSLPNSFSVSYPSERCPHCLPLTHVDLCLHHSLVWELLMLGAGAAWAAPMWVLLITNTENIIAGFTQTANKHPHSAPPRKDVITRSSIFTVGCCLFMGKSSGWHSEGTSLKTVYFKHNEIIVISKAGLAEHISFLKLSYGK